MWRWSSYSQSELFPMFSKDATCFIYIAKPCYLRQTHFYFYIMLDQTKIIIIVIERERAGSFSLLRSDLSGSRKSIIINRYGQKTII